MDAKSQHHSILLALSHQEERHLGFNIADNIKKIFTEFGISDRQLGYFIANNANNNDTCIDELSVAFGFNPLHHCLRCVGHIINLVARMPLFGANPNALDGEEEDPDAVLRQILTWRKIGPIGKLRNIIFWIFDSEQRIKKLLKLQDLELQEDALRVNIKLLQLSQ